MPVGQQVLNKAAALERVDGDEELYDEIVALFLEDAPIQTEKLREAVENGDQELIERQAHSLKSAAANIGGEVVSYAALQLESAVKKGDRDAVVELFETFVGELEKLNQALAALSE